MTCVVADIDNLKIVNDEYGHEGGDVTERISALEDYDEMKAKADECMYILSGCVLKY